MNWVDALKMAGGSGMVVWSVLSVMARLGPRGGSEPRCAKCWYDVRTAVTADRAEKKCPECGADLSASGAVVSQRRKPRPGLARAGRVVMVLSLLLLTAGSAPSIQAWVWETWDLRSNASFIGELASPATSERAWRKLISRYESGRLSKADVTAVIDEAIKERVAINGINRKRMSMGIWGGWGWPDYEESFVKAVYERGDIPPERLGPLYEAVCGPCGLRSLTEKIRQGEGMYVQAILLHSGITRLGLDDVAAIRSITADGKTDVILRSRGPGDAAEGRDVWSWSVYTNGLIRTVKVDLPPGEHTLEIVVDHGVLSGGSPTFRAGQWPGQMAKWAQVKYTWTERIQTKLTVLAATEPVKLITDKALTPRLDGRPTARVSEGPWGPSIVVDFPRTIKPAATLFAKVTVVVGGQRLEAGDFYVDTVVPQTDLFHGSVGVQVPKLDASVTSVDVVMTPDPEDARLYGWPYFYDIWGQPIEYTDVPLQREDAAPKRRNQP